VKLRALIVDDMSLARKRARRYLEEIPDVEIVGECEDGASAIDAVRELSPDLLLLDVQMPEVDGFDVLDAIGPDAVPAVVFVTAYDDFAVKAFEAHALDYLLKPFSAERLRDAVGRARERVESARTADIGERLRAMLAGRDPRPSYLKRVGVKSGGKTVFVSIDDLDYVEAAGNYLSLHAGNESYLIREKIGRFELRLDPERFVRIHRSTIVNVDRVKEMQPLFNGDQILVLRSGKQLTVSRTYRERLVALLGDY
jgi:two-component system LytT family response regulator